MVGGVVGILGTTLIGERFIHSRNYSLEGVKLGDGVA